MGDLLKEIRIEGGRELKVGEDLKAKGISQCFRLPTTDSHRLLFIVRGEGEERRGEILAKGVGGEVGVVHLNRFRIEGGVLEGQIVDQMVLFKLEKRLIRKARVEV